MKTIAVFDYLFSRNYFTYIGYYSIRLVRPFVAAIIGLSDISYTAVDRSLAFTEIKKVHTKRGILMRWIRLQRLMAVTKGKSIALESLEMYKRVRHK